jgi:hypothetical protein
LNVRAIALSVLSMRAKALAEVTGRFSYKAGRKWLDGDRTNF